MEEIRYFAKQLIRGEGDVTRIEKHKQKGEKNEFRKQSLTLFYQVGEREAKIVYRRKLKCVDILKSAATCCSCNSDKELMI